MSLQQTRPGGGSQRKRTHFVHNKTPRGGKWEAWIAGACHWFECHAIGRSKPCLEVVTKGELKCELCSPMNPRVLMGYQPLFKGTDGKPCFCVVRECSADVVESLKFRQPVLVGRDDGATDTVWVMPTLSKRPWHTSTLVEFQTPADLTPSLVTMWKLPALTEWYLKQTKHKIQTQPKPVVPKQVRVKSDNKPFSPMTQAVANRLELPVAEQAVADEYEKVLASLARKAGQNGQANGKDHKAD